MKMHASSEPVRDSTAALRDEYQPEVVVPIVTWLSMMLHRRKIHSVDKHLPASTTRHPEGGLVLPVALFVDGIDAAVVKGASKAATKSEGIILLEAAGCIILSRALRPFLPSGSFGGCGSLGI